MIPSAAGAISPRADAPGQEQVVEVAVVLAIVRHHRGPRRPGRASSEGQLDRASQLRRRSAADRLRLLELADRNAAMISLGRYDEPMSTQVYLSTSPRKNCAAVGALLADDLGALDQRASLTSSAPPSPEMTFLVSWKLNGREVAERAQRPALVGRAERLARRPRSRSRPWRSAIVDDRVHLARHAGVVDRHDRLACAG